MKDLKTSNTKTPGGIVRATGRTFGIGIPAAAGLSAAVAVLFAIAVDGCSQQSKKDNVSLSTPSSMIASAPVTTAPQTSVPVVKDEKPVTEPVAKPKQVTKKVSTVSYIDGVNGVSFRFPRTYTLSTPDKPWPDSRLEQLPMNFTQPGGSMIAALDLSGRSASGIFRVNLEQGVTAEQCKQFAVPEVSNGGNSPVNPTDNALALSKASVDGLEFSRTDFMTDKIDTRYYHHFESSGKSSDGIETGACYEFALGVQDAPDNTKAVDHEWFFDRLERIMETVKIKSKGPSAVTASTSTPQ